MTWAWGEPAAPAGRLNDCYWDCWIFWLLGNSPPPLLLTDAVSWPRRVSDQAADRVEPRIYLPNSRMASSARTPPVIVIGANGAFTAISALEIMI